jgi:Tol biopolymer transport system component
LINPDDPSQTVDVVQTKQVGRTYDPIWSPDGKTLIIVGLLGGFGSQPYAIDIASYLASKGLQP